MQLRRYVSRWQRILAARLLPLADYAPRTSLVLEEHDVPRARFRAIDAHNHLGRWLSQDHDWVCHDVGTLLRTLDDCNIEAVVNLDGMWGEELEANLERYDRAYPGRFFTFAQCDWRLARQRDFGARLARQLRDSARRGARGLKVWKSLGLHHRDAQGRLIAIDDPRLAELWEAAADENLPVLIHIADPVAFFQPANRFNERWEELRANPKWLVHGRRYPSFAELIEQFEHLIAAHPRTTFIGAHVGCYAENLAWVERMLLNYPNLHVDISGRANELGRQPRATRRLFEQYPDRILFGLDSFPPAQSMYAAYFRFSRDR